MTLKEAIKILFDVDVEDIDQLRFYAYAPIEGSVALIMNKGNGCWIEDGEDYEIGYNGLELLSIQYKDLLPKHRLVDNYNYEVFSNINAYLSNHMDREISLEDKI